MTNSTTTPFSIDKDIPGMFIHFIAGYRRLENATIIDGNLFISQVVPDWQASHLRDQWRWKKKNFGSFFLNLDSELQIKFQHKFGITDTEDQKYLDLVEKDPAQALWAIAPLKCQLLHNLMLFFCNHGIEQTVTDKITLDQLPPKNKRYGTSKTWGDYILGLAPEKQAFLLGQISAHYELQLKETAKPRPIAEHLKATLGEMKARKGVEL